VQAARGDAAEGPITRVDLIEHAVREAVARRVSGGVRRAIVVELDGQLREGHRQEHRRRAVAPLPRRPGARADAHAPADDEAVPTVVGGEVHGYAERHRNAAADVEADEHPGTPTRTAGAEEAHRAMTRMHRDDRLAAAHRRRSRAVAAAARVTVRAVETD